MFQDNGHMTSLSEPVWFQRIVVWPFALQGGDISLHCMPRNFSWATALVLLTLSACSGTQVATTVPSTFSPSAPILSTTVAPLLEPNWTSTATRVQPAATYTPALTATPLPSPTPTPTPTQMPTATLTPSSTPTPSRLALSVENVPSLTQLAVWGKGWITSLAWSPNGSQLALGSPLGVYVFDPRTRQPQCFISTAEKVYSLAFSPDGRILATAGKQVQLWNVATGQPIKTLRQTIPGFFRQLAFSRNGKWLGAIGPVYNSGGDPPSRLMVWRTTDDAVVQSIEQDGGGFGARFAFSPNNDQVALQNSGRVSLLDIITGKTTEILPNELDASSLAFTPDGASLIAGRDGEIRYVDLATGKLLKTPVVDDNCEFQLSPDSRWVACPSIWDVQSGQMWLSLGVSTSYMPFTLFAFSPDSQMFALVNSDGSVDFWEIATRQVLGSIAWPSVTSSLAFGTYASPNQPASQVLAAGDRQGQVTLIDPQHGQTITTTQVSTGRIDAVALSPSGQWLGVGTRQGTKGRLVVKNISTGEVIRTIDFDDPDCGGVCITALAFDLDGQAIAAQINSVGPPRAWNIQTGEEIDQPQQLRWYNANALGADAKGHLVELTYSESDQSYHVFDKYTGQVLGVLPNTLPSIPCEGPRVYSISSDERYVALGCEMPDLGVWELGTGRLVSAPEGHQAVGGDGAVGNVLQVSFSPYGYLLASSGLDTTVRLWDAITGRQLLTLTAHREDVFAIAFSPDGRYLASASDDGTLRLWGLHP